ncbi:M56 family metallopeptidase [Anaerocolumna sp. MB42-C2]|uniref:M56 family metallopeptidase n=1 Tax=Anaerocolumna sp. MB42-C2 TaxID=3070997 RepID=UPI0027DFA919|nr:M56 family metallopeptidase [Anaerocolumna sp. MB42-C2]WMJ86294.1 M56 family metallopeptidase [Anaerocolumna sp. MB42-C2]
MNDFILIVLSLSISGSLMALFLLIGKPIFMKHVSKAGAYYIWILVLLRLILPFSVEQSFMNQLFTKVSVNPHSINTKTIDNKVVHNDTEKMTQLKGTEKSVSGEKPQHIITGKKNQVNTAVKNKGNISVQNILVVIWLTGSIITLMFCVVSYIYFKLKIKDTNSDPDQEDVTVLHNLCSSKKVGLKYNSYVSTPMLIGILSPCIVIPGSDYVKNGKQTELKNILYHELMHYKRKDLIYKWFTVVVTSLHWFNPFMIPIRRQISRSCELSCDEAVIKDMNATQKQSYGETLLIMAAGKRMSAGILATTLCEEKKELKERLISIMKYRKRTSGMLFLSVIIAVLLTGCGTILGSVAVKDSSGKFIQGESSDHETQDIKTKRTDELKWYGETSLITDGLVLPDTMINSDKTMNDFLKSDKRIALLGAITKENIYVYGLKENGSSRDDFLYRLHGICIRQGNEIQVFDIDWGIYGDIPKIQYADYDNDGQKELAMILRSSSGTGLSLLDLHVFEKSDNGGWSDNYFKDWADQLNQLVTYKTENGLLKLFIKGEQIEEVDISALEKEWGEKFKEITFGDNVKYSFDEGNIYLQVLPKAIVGEWVTPQEITDSFLQFQVNYRGKFELSEVPAVQPVTESTDLISGSVADTADANNEMVENVISEMDNSVFEGNIGAQNICMAIYRDGEQLAASYITQKETDGEIMLQGTIQTGSASFTLYNEGRTITFNGKIKPDTSEGELLEGTCTYPQEDRKIQLPFTLTLSHTIGNTYDKRYSFTTTKTEDIEEFARKIKAYVMEDNKKGLGELIEYPINVTIKGSKISIRNKEEFQQNYDAIMNAETKERISNSYTKYMFSNYMGIMIGNGEIWFNEFGDKGLRIYAINN